MQSRYRHEDTSEKTDEPLEGLMHIQRNEVRSWRRSVVSCIVLSCPRQKNLAFVSAVMAPRASIADLQVTAITAFTLSSSTLLQQSPQSLWSVGIATELTDLNIGNELADSDDQRSSLITSAMAILVGVTPWSSLNSRVEKHIPRREPGHPLFTGKDWRDLRWVGDELQFGDGSSLH